MKVEQFVMAYGVEQDRRSVLCKDGEIFWPLMIFPEARYYHFADVEKDILQLATLMRAKPSIKCPECGQVFTCIVNTYKGGGSFEKGT